MDRSAGLPAGVQLASWGSRVGAYLLDGLIQLAIVVVCAVPGGILVGLDPSGALGIILLVVGILAGAALAVLVYPAATLQRDGPRNGQTLGKQAVGIRAVNTDGRPYQWGGALLREVAIKYLLFGIAGGFAFYVPTLLDWLWPLWDDQNRALHDMLAGSRVVRA